MFSVSRTPPPGSLIKRFAVTNRILPPGSPFLRGLPAKHLQSSDLRQDEAIYNHNAKDCFGQPPGMFRTRLLLSGLVNTDCLGAQSEISWQRFAVRLTDCISVSHAPPPVSPFLRGLPAEPLPAMISWQDEAIYNHKAKDCFGQPPEMFRTRLLLCSLINTDCLGTQRVVP